MISSWINRLRKLVSARLSAQNGLLRRGRATLRLTRPGQRSSPCNTAHTLGITLESLNLESARRQATLGKDYARSLQDTHRLKELRESVLTLPPHDSWEGNYTDWSADPFNDRNWRFQFHTLRWINPYLWDALDGSESSRIEWLAIVRSWAKTNLPPHAAPDIYAWKDMTDGNRAIQISIGAPLVDRKDEWYLDLLVEHRNWLLDERNIVEGNHGLHQNLGLFVVSAVLNDDIGIQRAIARLGDQVIKAFDDKGLNEEGSVGYHQMNLLWWRQAEQRLELEGYSLSQRATDRLDKAGRAMGHLLLPDGTMPQIGDGGRGKARRGLHPFLDQVRVGDVCENEIPTFQHYTNGFTVFRSGWGQTRPFNEESHTIIRHGRNLLRHSHNDRGSVHLYTAGRRWITDGGFHSYQQNDPSRSYTKSRLAHSLLDIPGQAYDEAKDVPAILTECKQDLHSIEILDDNFESATWKRRVVFLPHVNVWVIWDRVKCGGPELLQQQWLLDIGVEANSVDATTIELNDTSRKLQMQWLGDPPHFDIATGDCDSDSRRGLIGIRWKKMKPTKSLHAMFESETLESVVVISDPEHHGKAELVSRKPMEAFVLSIAYGIESHVLEFRPTSTRWVSPVR